MVREPSNPARPAPPCCSTDRAGVLDAGRLELAVEISRVGAAGLGHPALPPCGSGSVSGRLGPTARDRRVGHRAARPAGRRRAVRRRPRDRGPRARGGPRRRACPGAGHRRPGGRADPASGGGGRGTAGRGPRSSSCRWWAPAGARRIHTGAAGHDGAPRGNRRRAGRRLGQLLSMTAPSSAALTARSHRREERP